MSVRLFDHTNSAGQSQKAMDMVMTPRDYDFINK